MPSIAVTVLKIPAEIIYKYLKCTYTKRQTIFSAGQKHGDSCKCQDSCHCISHPHHLRKLHQQWLPFPVIMLGSAPLYLYTFCLLLHWVFYATLHVKKPTFPPPPPPENPYVAYWTLWKYSRIYPCIVSQEFPFKCLSHILQRDEHLWGRDHILFYFPLLSMQ